MGTFEQAEKLRRQRATASMLDKGYSHWTYGAKPLEADPAAAPLPPHGPAPVPPPARSIPPIKSAHTARLPTPKVRTLSTSQICVCFGRGCDITKLNNVSKNNLNS